MSAGGGWLRKAGLMAAGALISTAPVLLADEANDFVGSPTQHALLAAQGWSDLLPGQGSPMLPDPSATETAIVVLEAPPLGRVTQVERESALVGMQLDHDRVRQVVEQVGGSVGYSYRTVANGLSVTVPTGRLGRIADIPGVSGVYPITYLHPAQVATPLPQETAPAPGPSTGPVGNPSSAPLTVALIDTGVHPEHPWLGGGIGLDRLIIGGADLVDGTDDPRPPVDRRDAEAHGTQMASLVTHSELLRDLPADRLPRLRAYRVAGDEQVAGRSITLARSDRVLAALELAVDPDSNGDPSDHSSVILLGVVSDGSSGGQDPLAQAAEVADRAGSLIVAPSGNSGPGGAAGVGTIGAIAASPSVLTVGGAGAATTPRTATVHIHQPGRDEDLTGVPLLGPEPPDGNHPVVALIGQDGLLAGTDVRDYTDARGQSRVVGAVVVVGRGRGSLQSKARAAAQAGAAMVIVWDQDGSGMFPGVHADGDVPIPMLGVAQTQGQAFVASSDISVSAAADPTRDVPPSIAAFSSRGPTAAGALAPDVVAPAVDVRAAYPGVGAEEYSVRMSGTSAAAAQVAALAVRIREANPYLTPADIRSVIAQSARPLAGTPTPVQGAGRISERVEARAVAIEPEVVSAPRPSQSPTTVTVRLHELTGSSQQVRLGITDAFDRVIASPQSPVDLAAGGYGEASITLPVGTPDFAGRLHVVSPSGEILASAPIATVVPPSARARIVPPRILTQGGATSIEIVIQGVGGGTTGVHDLQIRLVPSDGADPLPLTHPRIHSEWPTGTYRLRVTARAIDSREISEGRYTVQVTARSIGGSRVSATVKDVYLSP